MAKTVTSVSEEGSHVDNQIRDFDHQIDAQGEETPDTLETLLAAYASCYVPALRVGSRQRGVEGLGRVEIEATGELNDDDKLASIAFSVETEADFDEETAEAVRERAAELCKVHDALTSQLHATVTFDGSS